MFCRECGTTMLNPIIIKCGTEHNPTDVPGAIFGVFPGTFTHKMSELTKAFQPTFHLNCEFSLVDVSRLQDGLPKHLGWAGTPLVA